LSWMATIIRNRALDLLRHAQWERPLKSEIEPAKPALRWTRLSPAKRALRSKSAWRNWSPLRGRPFSWLFGMA
jgi:hypothetical protein